VMFVIAYPLQRWILGPLVGHGLEGPLVATFGLSIIAQTVFVLAFGGNPKALDAPYTLTGTNVGGITERTIFIIALIAGLVSPTPGLAWLLRAFTVIVLGGMGSVWGSFLGGAVVGIAEEFGAASVGPSYRDLVVFSLLVLVLVARPQGLLGRRLG